MIRDGLGYPLRGERPLVRLMVATALVPFAFLGVPAFALVGYAFRVVGDGVGARVPVAPPPVRDPVRLLLDGVWSLAVCLAYAVPIATAGVVGLTLAPGTGAGAAVGVAALASGYAVVPAALARAAVEGRFAAAFDVRGVGRALAAPGYLASVALATVAAVVAGAGLIGLGTLAPIAAAVAAVPVAVYVHLVVCRTTGRAYRTHAVADAGIDVDTGAGDRSGTAPDRESASRLAADGTGRRASDRGDDAR
jgi:hypothetical protein